MPDTPWWSDLVDTPEEGEFLDRLVDNKVKLKDKKHMKLIECLARAGKVPFIVKVTQAGGQYVQGHELAITNVSVRAEGEYEGEIQYDFDNMTTDRSHKKWRHDSGAEFELIEAVSLPEEVEHILEAAGFTGDDTTVRRAAADIVKLLGKK